MSLTSTASVNTDRASGYLQQLCKHFSHKLETQFTAIEGSIEFGFGRAHLQAQDSVLTLTASAPDPASLERLKTVLGSHLERFAFREALAMTWSA